MKITTQREITVVLDEADAKELQAWMLRAWNVWNAGQGGTTVSTGFPEPVVQALYNALIGVKP